MARKAKEAEVFTVRTACGGLVGTYRAMTAHQAISRAVRDCAATAATFRKSQPMPRNMDSLTADVVQHGPASQ